MSEPARLFADVEVEAARQLLRHLIRLVRSHRLYDGDHPTLRGLYEQLRERWEAATAGGPLPLLLTPQAVLLDDEPVYLAAAGRDVLPTVLFEHGIVGFTLLRGVTAAEAERFVKAIAREPDPSIDYPTLLWESDLEHVEVLLDGEEAGHAEPATPSEFASQIANLADSEDPHVGEDYDRERAELRELIAARAPGRERSAEPANFRLTELERQRVATILRDDTYAETVRHAAHVVHAIAAADASAEPASLDAVVSALARAMVAAGDLDGILAFVRSARRLADAPNAAAKRVGERTLECFRGENELYAVLRQLDARGGFEARALGDLIHQLGASSVATVCRWLLETPFPEEAARALRVYPAEAARELIPLFRSGGPTARERLAPVLLDLGTPETLAALTTDLAALSESGRLRLVEAVSRSGEDLHRHVLARALEDPSEAVRRAALGALRRQDAPRFAAALQRALDERFVATRGAEEVRDWFEAAARVGDASVATLLAQVCMRRGLKSLLRGLTPLQERCVRALRRMRAPDVRPVVEELRRKGSRAVRNLLDDPLAELDV